MVAQVLRRPAAPAKNSVDWEAPAKNGCDHVPEPARPDHPRPQADRRGMPLLEGNQEEWIACCSERFFPLARRVAGDDRLAEEALQASWIKILQAVNHACFSGPKACPWVNTIVVNAARDVRRRRLRQGEVSLSEVANPGLTPEALAREKQLLALLREIIALLPDTYRQIVELRLRQGLSTGQTAQQLHVSRVQFATRLNRAIGMIRRRIDAPRIGTAPH